MGNIFCCFTFIKWERYRWIFPWNRMGWSANLYDNDWNVSEVLEKIIVNPNEDGRGPPVGTNDYDLSHNKKKGVKATFAMGHFLRAESRFGIVEGVLRSRLGYTGGRGREPSFYNIGDHVPAVDIEYDPNKITYKELLQHFWNGHDYTKNSKTYPSVIFYHDKQQEVVARLSRQERQQYEEINLMAENPWPRKVVTRISKCKKFWPAEMYAQKHTLYRHENLLEWIGISTDRQLIWSTLAMRLNSILMGEVEQRMVHDYLDRLKLPDEVYNYILFHSQYQEHAGAKTRTTGKQRFEEIII